MRTTPGFLILLAVFALQTAGQAAPVAADAPEIVIYAYDSFLAKGGLGPEIIPIFESRQGCKVKALPSGDGGQLLNRLQLDFERGKPTAHVVVGLDQNLWTRARTWLEPWGSWTPKGYAKLPAGFRISGPGATTDFLPFDYGVFALMADGKKLKELGLSPPDRLEDLLERKWKRNLILEDPRTSTPGLAFLLYTRAVKGPGTDDFWTRFKGQWLTLAPGWDGAYGLFLKGEAPLVWSYTTSQAYHVEHGDTEARYRAVLFAEGQPAQIEGAALVKGAPEDAGVRRCARGFLEFLLTAEVQERVPRKNWMLPVVPGTKVPESFRALPVAKKLYQAPVGADAVNEALAAWNRVIEGTR